MTSPSSCVHGYITIEDARKLASAVEAYEVLVSDLLAIVAYLLKGSDNASTSSTVDQYSTGSASEAGLGDVR